MQTQKAVPADFASTPAFLRYGSILFLDRPAHDGDPFSRRHPPMPRQHRAKIFAPFAALEGFDARVRSKDVPYVPRRALDADERRALNQALSALRRLTRTGPLARQNRARACVEYFEVCADGEHDACGRMGLYHTVTDVVRGVDPVGRTLRLGSRTIPFADIDSIAFPAATDDGFAKARRSCYTVGTADP